MMKKDTCLFCRSSSFSSHYPLGRLKCNFIALQRNAMRVQCNGVATQCDCNALQSDCNAYAIAMRWGGCNREAVAMRLQRDALRLQCDAMRWRYLAVRLPVLCFSQGPRVRREDKCEERGSGGGFSLLGQGEARRREEGCDCNAIQCNAK